MIFASWWHNCTENSYVSHFKMQCLDCVFLVAHALQRTRRNQPCFPAFIFQVILVQPLKLLGVLQIRQTSDYINVIKLNIFNIRGVSVKSVKTKKITKQSDSGSCFTTET